MLGVFNGVRAMKNESQITEENVIQLVKEHFIDDGRVKGGPTDWANAEVIENLFGGIIEGTQLYTQIALKNLLYYKRLQVELKKSVSLEDADPKSL